MPRKILQGTVVSNKTDKTITVKVERTYTHRYGKIIKSSKKYTAHDPENQCTEGEVVKIGECRPISRTKSWIVLGS